VAGTALLDRQMLTAVELLMKQSKQQGTSASAHKLICPVSPCALHVDPVTWSILNNCSAALQGVLGCTAA
jgi:hypothetical protein